tara:strand:+ start:312 stop:413 length:102 start_codon:yes stop_codon:yes gene_type:complete
MDSNFDRFKHVQTGGYYSNTVADNASLKKDVSQ